MTRQKTMEIFTGSLESLERMTGKNYEAMKIDGKLVDVTGLGCKGTSPGRDVDGALRRVAWDNGADAVVEVTYVPVDARLDINLNYRTHDVLVYARGYCVKEVQDTTLHSEAEADIDV